MVKKLSAEIIIPPALVEAVKSRRVILFLGAGASRESVNASGERPPDADKLRDIIARQFFGKEIKNRDVMTVAEMAIETSGGRSLVFEAVRKAFDGYTASEAHKLLTTFSWRMIATTNYDLLIESAYAESKGKVQNLVRFVKDDEPVEAKMQGSINPLQYLKLHGCLEHIHDNDIPLVLSREQYSQYITNRTRLFGRIKDLAVESTIVFIGYRLDDAHIRELIYQLSGSKRPRWYIISPDAEDIDVAFWSTKNIEAIRCRFGQFMTSLDRAVPQLWRSLTPSDSVADFPIREKYKTRTEESQELRASIGRDITFVHSGMPVADQSPKRFYEGYDTGWGCILRLLDVRRKVEQDLLYSIALDNEKPSGPVLLVIRGAAGSGKTIALKRTAFEAAAHGLLVLWLEESGALRFNAFMELYELTGLPIYLFVDQLALQTSKVHALLKAAKTQALPLVVVGAERDSDWNTYCGNLESEYSPKFIRVGNLLVAEVEALLDLLERYDSLGLLKEKTREEQVKAFVEKERADRQLLVALHELTQGKPFEEIILNEHDRIYPEKARQLYLDIATMHQFSVTIRAGTISRISGIDFEDFEREFFSPLMDIVRIEKDNYTGDYCYKTRHSRVAALVFRQVCGDDQLKSAQFRRIMRGMDVGYSSDRRALEEMTRGRSLTEVFSGVSEVREIYETAIIIAPKQSFVFQQWAIFESNHKDGSLIEAERIAEMAREADPRNKSIIHTQAEVDRKRANAEASPLLRDSLRMRARNRLNELPGNDRFTVSSRCKILVDELYDLNAGLSDDAKAHEALYFSDKVSAVETALLRAQQMHADDADIIQIEARFRALMSQEDKALSAFERAWSAGIRGSSTAIRIAEIYSARERPIEALKFLKEAVSREPDDRAIHGALAHFYLAQPSIDNRLIEDHFRKSFFSEDQNFEARFQLAQFLFMDGNVDGSVEMFEVISRRSPTNFRHTAPKVDNSITNKLPRYSGTIEDVRERFLFIRSACYPSKIFTHRSYSDPEIFDELTIGQEVNFRIRFNRAGPTAVNILRGRL